MFSILHLSCWGNTENEACEWLIATVERLLRAVLRTPALPNDRKTTGPTRREESRRERKRARQSAGRTERLSTYYRRRYATPEPEEDWGAEDWARVPLGSLIPDEAVLTAASA